MRREDGNGPVVLELRGLRKTIGAADIINGLNLKVLQGERVAIIGPNGAGKSTLFNLVSGQLPLSAGEILLRGQHIEGKSPYAINRLRMGRSFQTSSLFPGLSVFENLRCARLWQSGFGYSCLRFLGSLRGVNARVEELLDLLGLAHRRDVPAMHLSYAEQRALEIGVTVAGGADVLLLDEPTAGMSRTETVRFLDLIRQLSVGKTLLMVEHDMSVVFALADRVAVMVNGSVIAFDTPERVRADRAVQQAYLGPMPAMGPDTVAGPQQEKAHAAD